MPNFYAQFRKLLPEPPLMVGEVTNLYGTGVVEITTPDGGRQLVRGVATLGQRVFARAGAIEGPAPSLAQQVIEI